MNKHADRGPEEFNEFLFGPKDNPDGTTPMGDEERRRQQAIVLHAQALAQKHGIEIEATTVRPLDPVAPTQRAAEIKAIADAIMPQADEGVRTSFERSKVTLPDGSTLTLTRLQMGCLDSLAEAIKSLSPASLRGKLRMCFRVGKLVKVDAEASLSDSD
jgi:hypothetical protein